jgi:hypothetical protein
MRLHEIAVGLLVMTSVSPALAAPKARAVVVEAGAHPRRDVVVSFEIPEGATGPFRLRDGKKEVPLQVAGGRGFFVVGDLKAGAAKTYSLETVSEGKLVPGVEAKTEGENVLFSTRGGRGIVRYLGGKGALVEGAAAEYQRAGYFHPVFTPDGRTITDDQPKDHRHQHGIWFAWTKTDIDGRAPDFWNMGQKKASIQFESLDEVWSGAVHAGLRAKNRYIDMTAGGDPQTALWEKLVLHVYSGGGPAAAPYWLFDLEVIHDRVGTTPLNLPKYHYGGLGVRGAAEWKATPAKLSVLTSEGKERANGNETQARWYRMSGELEGKPAALVSFGHPSNFRAPQPMRINPDDPFICWAPSQLGDWAIEPGQPYVARYRFAVFSNVPEAPEIERLWNDYAEPPKVTVR